MFPHSLRDISSGVVSAADATQTALQAIAAKDDSIHAFVHVDREGAIAHAEQIDARRGRGEMLGPLAGIPVAVKDLFVTTDMPTTCGSRILAGYASPVDAEVVRRLRLADAVLIGKTNMDEFAMGGSTETGYTGVTRNPCDVSRTAGGSSGGSAAAVAAGMAPLAVGSDTGGSIRQPAAFCGLTGLKPTYGRVSRRGMVAFASSLDQGGPMAATAVDCAMLLDVIAGHDPGDTTSLNQPYPPSLPATASDDLRGLKIGVLEDVLEHDGVSEATRRATQAAAETFRSLGCDLQPIALPHAEYWVPTYYVIAPSEASSNLSRFDGARYGHRAADADQLATMYSHTRGEGFGREVKRRIMIGTYALSEGYADQYYKQALKVRRLIRGDFDAAMSQVDLVLGPATPASAFRLGEKTDDPVSMYLEDLFTVGANLAGIPAVSFPGGKDPDGLPIGIQLQGPPLSEARLLMATAAFQRATDFV
ncbi:MAG: Asp-tRNA(Asn)/Glu-tRNA(Gln) amidotransferase subunit GatA [Planctomycetota bacterium]